MGSWAAASAKGGTAGQPAAVVTVRADELAPVPLGFWSVISELRMSDACLISMVLRALDAAGRRQVTEPETSHYRASGRRRYRPTTTQPYALLMRCRTKTPDPSTVAANARLLSLAVHELRTPASVVGGYLRMLQRDTTAPLSERQRKMVDEAAKSYGRMVALIDELSEISKLDAGTAAVQEESFDLFGLVQEVADSVHEVGGEDVKVQVRGEADRAPSRAIGPAFVRPCGISSGDFARTGFGLHIVVDRRRRRRPGARAVSSWLANRT
jgi:signal transduction histidine kinase